MARATRARAGRTTARWRSRQPLLRALGLLACVVLLCGAGWDGHYMSPDGGSEVLFLAESDTGSLTVDLLRIAVGNPAKCQIRVEACPAVADADGFRAGPCPARLAGTEGATCTGTLDLHLQGTKLASAGSAVGSLSLRTTLNDWPVVLERRRSCGVGFELTGVLPLLWLTRRGLPARRGRRMLGRAGGGGRRRDGGQAP